MIKTFKGFSILNTVFNIRAGEWPRVAISWIVQLLYRTSFVIAWTVVVGLFVARYGIYYLPFLFVANAVFTIIGSVFYSTFFNRFKLEYLMIGTVLASCFLFLFAHIFASEHQILFFSLLLVSISVFLMQLRIILGSFVEEIFSPLESQRTFPFIESAETFGGIVAGLVITILIGNIETSNFIYLLVCLLLLILPLVLIFKALSSTSHVEPFQPTSSNIIEVLSNLKRNHISPALKSYVLGIIFIVALHFMLFNLLEFQYTKVIYQNASHVVLEAGSGFEHSIVHDLGKFFILFNSLALFVQLLIGSRLINSLGIVGSMILHPIVAIFSVVGLIFSFSFPTAILAKTNFTLTSVIFLNAHHSSYYAIPENLRNHVRELLVGVVRPIGAIIGAGFLIVVQQIFASDSHLVLSVNVLMLIVSIVFLVATISLQKKYSSVAIELFGKNSSKSERSNAIEILSQRGHKNGVDILKKLILNPKESTLLRIKSVHLLSDSGNVDLVPVFLDFLKIDNAHIKRAVVLALCSFPGLRSHLTSNPILERDFICDLRNLFNSSRSLELRKDVLKLLSVISTLTAIDFLLSVVDNASNEIKADAVLLLSNYNDPMVCDHILKYLKSKNFAVRASALVVLKKFKYPFRSFNSNLKYFTDNRSPKSLSAAMLIIGELGINSKADFCLECAHSNNIDVKMSALIALVRLRDSRVISIISDFCFTSNSTVAFRVKSTLASIDTEFSAYILAHILHSAVQKIKLLHTSNGSNKSKKRLGKHVLTHLRRLSFLADEYDDVDDITELLLQFA